jgi:O-acetyl-ADP-ribose deacetylase (regulator of RNase III)
MDVANVPKWSDMCTVDWDALTDLRFGRQHVANDTLNARVRLWRGDITSLRGVDCIVNAARPSLEGGGGIDRAIHAACGSQLKQHCISLAPTTAMRCVHGDAVKTPSFQLAQECGGPKWVIHVVGPHCDLHNDEQRVPLLRQAYESVLRLSSGIVGVCCISAGAYRYPSHEAAHIALDTCRYCEILVSNVGSLTCCRRWLECNMDSDVQIVFCVYTELDEKIYTNLMKRYYFTKPHEGT